MDAGRSEELKPVIQPFTLMCSVYLKNTRFSVSTKACIGPYWLLISWYNWLYIGLVVEA